MKFIECEFKYTADNISLTKFQEFCESRPDYAGVPALVASGYDHFYASSKDTDAFCRHRYGPDMNQLTFKRKTTDVNNYVRTEHNLDFTKDMTTNQVQAYIKEHGYEFNIAIFKNCFIYKYDWYTLVYYICYNTDMRELGRFLEIEMKEDYAWKNKDEAWNALVAMERLCKPLGLSAQKRIRLSLFEMFKQDIKKYA